MHLRIGCVVEGHGEREAVPVLLRRILNGIDPGFSLQCEVLREPRSSLVQPGNLERAALRAAHLIQPADALLVLIDADDDCPGQLGPELHQRARSAVPHIPLGLVLAKREFEAWFLAAAESLRGLKSLEEDLQPPAEPEGIRDAKGWLTGHMRSGFTYSPTLHQAALCARMDLAAARRAPSFDKLWRELERLAAGLRQ